MFHNIAMQSNDGEKLNRLIIAVAKGDADSLDGIYALAGGRMYAVALSVVGKTYAEDVLHDSFIKIARFAKYYKKNSSPYAWLMKIVRNTALDCVRSGRAKNETQTEELYFLTDGGYSSEKAENAIALEEALKKLAPDERRVIYYVYYLDMTVREIADELKTSKSAVQRTKDRAEKNLKILLERGTNDR